MFVHARVNFKIDGGSHSLFLLGNPVTTLIEEVINGRLGENEDYFEDFLNEPKKNNSLV